MSSNSKKNQYIFTEPAKIDAVLSDNGTHDRETVRLLRQAVGRKFLPLRGSAIPAEPSRVGPYEDVNYVTLDPSLVSSHIRTELDLVAEWIKAGRQSNAAWLKQHAPDGRVAMLTHGFDKAAAEARKFFYGTKKKPPVYHPAAQDIQTLIYTGEEGARTVYSDDIMHPLSAQQMTDILSFRIPDRMRVVYSRVAVNPDMTKILPQIHFHLEGFRSRTNTRWSCDPVKGETTFAGWSGKDITKQLFANRMALYTVLGCTDIKSNFANVGQYAFARYGFLPTVNSWSQISYSMLVMLPAISQKLGIAPDIQKNIEDILHDKDTRALWKLVDLPHRTADGKSIAYEIMKMSNATWQGTYDLNNPEQVARTRAYVGPEMYDAAMDNAHKVTRTVPATRFGSTPTDFHYRLPSPGLE